MPTKKNATRPQRVPVTRIAQNFHLVWLDGSIDEENDEDCRNSITKLRQVVNTVNTFTDVDECIDFITDINEQNAFMIISESFIQTIIPIVQDIPQVNSIYALCKIKEQQEKYIENAPKIKGIFTDVTSICETLKQATFNYDQNAVSISFIQVTDGSSNQNLNTLDQSFMYTQILKDILLSIDFKKTHIDEFLQYARQQLADNTIELEKVDEIANEYHLHKPIWWYTYNSFLYSVLNRALRTMEVDLIVKMGFFVRDLHNHIAELHAEQFSEQNQSVSFTVYRGQGLSVTDFDQLMKTQGGLMSFNNFLSTSLDEAVSRAFAESSRDDSNLVGVFFKITILPSIPSFHFAKIKDISYYKTEEEILFSMHSVFRIGQVKQLDESNRLWEVDLILTSDNDPQLHALTKQMQEETEGPTGWHRLGKLMIKLGQYEKAEELYDVLLKQTNNEREKSVVFNQLGYIKDDQGKYGEAVELYEKSIKIDEKNLSPTDPSLGTSYNNIGTVYDNMGDYSKALEIDQKILPANHPDLATSYNNIGYVYCNMGEYSKALSYYERTLDILQCSLHPNHPHVKIVKETIDIIRKKL